MCGTDGCPRFIKGYVDNHTPKEWYSPHILSGMNVGDANNIVLKLIDDCAPSAPHFGFMEQNVFKEGGPQTHGAQDDNAALGFELSHPSEARIDVIRTKAPGLIR